jgi:glc operon protein GlcG
LLQTKTVLTLSAAKHIASLIEQEAIKLARNISIAIVNESGTLIFFSKMDESTDASGDIAIAKAKHAAYYKRDTKFHEDLLAKGNNIVLSLPNSSPIEGGVQLKYQNKTIGAIGVSGALSAEDGLLAKAGADFILSIDTNKQHP